MGSRGRVHQALCEAGLLRETARGGFAVGRVFRDSDRRWVPRDLRVVTLGEYAHGLGRDHGALAVEAEQVGVLDTFPMLQLHRRAQAIETACSNYSAVEDTKVLAYSIDPDEWDAAEPFRTTRTEFLTSFCELGRRPDLILPYAMKWGPLRLCEHGLPPGHLVAPGIPVCTAIGMEPFTAWQGYAQVAEAIMVTAGRLYQGLPAYEKDWKILARYLPFDPMYFDQNRIPVQKVRRLHELAANPEQQKRVVLYIVDLWCQWGEVATERWWSDTGVVRDRTGVGLFGKIAREIDCVVRINDGGVSCENCGRAYVPERMNKPGIPYICDEPDCRLAADRLTAQRLRERKREKASFADLVDFAKLRGTSPSSEE